MNITGALSLETIKGEARATSRKGGTTTYTHHPFKRDLRSASSLENL
jgi:hypothetical protein